MTINGLAMRKAHVRNTTHQALQLAQGTTDYDRVQLLSSAARTLAEEGLLNEADAAAELCFEVAQKARDNRPSIIEVAWNTGRLYTDRGQPMAARFDRATMTVRFVDDARMIDGHFECDEEIESADELRRVTMHCYDGSFYQCGLDADSRAELRTLARGERQPFRA